ncbi:hypothetical protein [Haladaptatus cibarius]|uniref:hypothetical protein n=1 Tax=Haladaptatus cibarius TaxID=453847 RepID=UPI00067911FD|nr:hypothetical protein [Haladaptatus cibarius]
MIGSIIVITTAGCLTETEGDRSPTTTDSGDSDESTPTDSDNAVENRVKACERQYIEREIVDDDETIGDSLEPQVIETEARSEGEYVKLETAFGVTKSSGDEPDEHRDYLVKAAYLVTDDETYRTKGTDAEGNPRDGTTLDC